VTAGSEFAVAVVIFLALLGITTWGMLTRRPGEPAGPFWAPVLATLLVAAVTLFVRAATGI